MLRTAATDANAGCRWMLRSLVTASFGLAIAALPVQSQVTFNSLGSVDGSGVRYVPNCYMEGGLIFTVVGEACGTDPDGSSALATYTADNGSFTGTPALFNNFGDAFDITAVGGANFTLNSIDLAPIFLLGFGNGIIPVSFTGMLAAGGTVAHTADVPLSATGLTNFIFFDFTGLSSVRVTPGAPDFSIQFDNVSANVNASVVPEPSSYLLTMIGLAGIGFISRRRTRVPV